MLAAVQYEIDAGAAEQAHDLLATAESGPLDDLQRARLERLRARLIFSRCAPAPARRREPAGAPRRGPRP
ncbi:hypothetical protein [Streptomyces wuyuanensis]|uniref:hypothetical protein n=1 Tax=Streptomyces wuyuanensis TaxID=1196353 RepID=UPI003D70B987